MPLSDEDGRKAVSLARETLDAHASGRGGPQRGPLGGVFAEKRGVFVTLNSVSHAEEGLRGCIGFPYPVMKLEEAVVEATVAAASRDPRFPPVAESELDGIVVEVSVLTLPVPLKAPDPRDLPSMVRIGVDGLIASRAALSGLLLPQVATDFGMGQTEFLSQACLKAGLPADAWLQRDTEVQAFQAEIFAEPSPRKPAVRLSPAGS